MNKNPVIQEEETKSIGGPIPKSLYWEFKRVQAERKETALQALENAIRLYLDIDKKEESNNG